MKKSATLVLALILAASCAPSPQAVQTAMAQTQIAQPSALFTPRLLAETPTNTSTTTFSPTPDLLFLQANLKNFLLQLSDFPANSGYDLASLLVSNQPSLNPWPVPNEKVDFGEDLAITTERMDGWTIFYSTNSNPPNMILNTVALHKTNGGASLAASKYCTYYITQEGWIEESNPPDIGDFTCALYKNEKNSPGTLLYSYIVAYSYRNVSQEVIAHFGGEVKPELVRILALALLAKLQEFYHANQ